MHTLEFTAAINADNTIQIPAHLTHQLLPGTAVQVRLSWSTDPEAEAGQALGRRTFEAAYAPEDEMYEQLAHDIPHR